MKLAEKDIVYIKDAWQNVLTKEDLLALLNYTKALVYGTNSLPFELKQLTWYANPRLNSNRYKTFSVKKKSGGIRTIHAPVKGLKAIQRTLAFVLQCIYEPHAAATGFVRKKSIVDNARFHEGQKYVYNIDLKDFFPSINQARVWKCLQLAPFNLKGKKRSTELLIGKFIRKAESDFIEFVPFSEKRKEKVLVFRYEKKNYKKGVRKYVTEKGTKMSYKVLPAGQDSGTIILFKNETELDKLEAIAENAIKTHNLDASLDLVRAVVIENTIDIDQQKTQSEDNIIGLADMVACLCCTEIEVERKNETDEWVKIRQNVLPQGAPTSPVISNIVCQRLDFLLTGVAKRFGLKYSRYADDITFSSMHNVYQSESEFVKELERIIKQQGFHIKESKTRLQKEGYRQEVTGLLVNEKANVQKGYVKQLRMWLYYWERYGYDRAYSFFLQQYVPDKGHVKKGQPDMVNVISGKLDYLRMVKGVEDNSYVKLKERLDILTGKVQAPAVVIAKKTAFKGLDLLNELLGKKRKKTIVKTSELPPKSTTEIDFNASSDPTVIQSTTSSVEVKPESHLPVVHNPKGLVQLLSKFSENNHPLKYACHSWDYGRVDDLFDSYSDFINQYDEHGRSVCFDILKLKRPLGTKILHFLNTLNQQGTYYNSKKNTVEKYYWGEYAMTYGWKSEELSKWAKENPQQDPFDFPLPKKTVVTKRNKAVEISKFGDVIKIFKDEIEMRPEESALYSLFAELRRKHLGFDFAVILDDSLKGKQFYTDVHEFRRALNKIFSEISKRTFYPNVSVSANNFLDEGYTLIEILHQDSYCNDKTSNEMMDEAKDGDFGDIMRYLENLCDWSIETKFSDGAYKINYLSSSEADIAKEKISDAEGFKHVFKFYKT